MDFVNLNATAAAPDDFAHAAATIGCEVAAFRAVIAVETGGRGFDDKGRPKALFEPHVFDRILPSDKRARARAAGLSYRSWGARPYPKDSYPRIIAACGISEELALQATSWGLPQILGKNHKDAGYDSALKMVAAFMAGESEQIAAMARWIVAQRGLALALAVKDWAAFARGYNGPRYAVNSYDKKLAKAHAHYRLETPMAAVVAPLPAPRVSATIVDMSRPVLRKGDIGPAVGELQHELIEEGFALTADGAFGPDTEVCLRAFQRRLGLTPDGVCGPVTWGALHVSTGPKQEVA
jgi:hypothetical protein